MDDKIQPGWVAHVALIAVGVVLLWGIVAGRLPFGSLHDYGYCTTVVVLIFLYGQAAATHAYYKLTQGPEATQYKTEEELDSEGRRRASIAFEKGSLRGLLVVGIPGFLAWILTHLLSKAL